MCYSYLAHIRKEIPRRKKHGATIIIQKKDNIQIRGELILIRENWLLLLNAEGKDTPVDIGDIKVIRIVKKSKVAKGALTGLLISAAFAVVLVGALALSWGEDMGETLSAMAEAAGASAPSGAFVGAIIAQNRYSIWPDRRSFPRIRPNNRSFPASDRN
ncbi:MAG: hypothetical protein OEY25_09400 [Candidatus Aminicenantes bacterium]|nr:hypothetical protein [Candidatus Aminicenantes bacterium]